MTSDSMTDAEIQGRIIALFEQLPRDQREAFLIKLRQNLGFTSEQIDAAIHTIEQVRVIP